MNTMKNKSETIKNQQVWESGFDGHSNAQLRRLAKLTFREKVEWLESMQKLQHRIKKREVR
mgnify:CR=1 FL=1